MEFRAGKFFLFFGLFCVLISLGILSLFTFIEEEATIAVILGVLFISGFLLALGVFFLLHYYNYSIILTEKSMMVQNELGRRKEIFWKDIDQVTFNKTMYMHVHYHK
jgi:hypothetical protein